MSEHMLPLGGHLPILPQTAGRLLVLEGPDGVGKTTLAKALAESLVEKGLKVTLLSFPGREPGTIGAVVYRLHHDPKSAGLSPLDPAVLQMLHIAAHLDAIKNRILPALAAGQYVVLDRYWWSTLVYGLRGGADAASLKKMIEVEKYTWGAVLPNYVFMLSRPSSANKDVPKLEFDALSKLYRKVAAREGRKYPVAIIGTETSMDRSLHQILKTLDPSAHQLVARDEDCPSPPLFVQNYPPRAEDTGSPPDNNAGSHQVQGVTVVRRMGQLIPTTVYDTFWQFAAERQEIFFRRFSGSPPPWTNDPILQEHKFTNCYRAADRVSQYLIKEVIYRGDQAPEELFFRVLMFKLFNKIETWELLERELGSITYAEYSFQNYDSVLSKAFESGARIYSGAYIMPSGGQTTGTSRKHGAHLHLLESMMKDKVAFRLANCGSMCEAFNLLRAYPMMGDFLSYQYVTDINYSELTGFSEMEFVVPGPGARSGIRKCFESIGGNSEPDVIKVVTENQPKEFERLGIDFKSLWGRPLQLIDCQNLFCEVDKYARVKHPGSKGISGRSRIKQRFHPNLRAIRYWFPPAWGLNDIIESSALTGERNGHLRW